MPVDYYEVEKMDLASGRWVPCGRADGDKTAFEVKNLQAGHAYQFRVRAVNKGTYLVYIKIGLLVS